MTVTAQGVCVVIAARNAEASIGRAVGSALAQKPVREVIVVDDASTDGTAAAARAADDRSKRLKVVRQNENRGPAGARNRAFDIAKSPLVCPLDADDYLLPGRIERLLAGATGHWDLLADDIVIVPQELQHLDVHLGSESTERSAKGISLASFVRGNITRPDRPRGELGFLKPLIKRAFLTAHGLRYDESLRLGEDYALYVRALAAGARFRVVGACGYIAIERNDSISARHGAADLNRLAQFDAACLAGLIALNSAERAAFRDHHAATHDKAVHRVALDLKRERGVAAALYYLAGRPLSVPHITVETWRAKRKALEARFSRGRRHAPRHIRLAGAVGSVLPTAVRHD
jgi:succinoglycan biosynthesis protein ExoU